MGCDTESAGLPDADGSVTLEIAVNDDGTITTSGNGFEEAVNAGTSLRVRARGIDGETLYDVTGGDVPELLRKLRNVPGDRRMELGPVSPEMRAAMRDLMEGLPSRDELLSMTPSERAAARKAFEEAMARADAMRADAMRGVK